MGASGSSSRFVVVKQHHRMTHSRKEIEVARLTRRVLLRIIFSVSLCILFSSTMYNRHRPYHIQKLADVAYRKCVDL